MPEDRLYGQPLDENDLEALDFLGRGNSVNDIGDKADRSAAVRQITKTGRKLGTHTAAQTLLEAYRRGLFTLSGSDARRAVVRDRPGTVWWQHVCNELEAFPRDSPPADGHCLYCGSSSPHRADWRPLWVGDRPQAVQP